MFKTFEIFEKEQIDELVYAVVVGNTIEIESYIIGIYDIDKIARLKFRDHNIKKLVDNKQKLIIYYFDKDDGSKFKVFRNENDADEYALINTGNVFDVPLNKEGHWNGIIDKKDQ